MLRSRAAFLEQALLVILAALATMHVERIILFTPHVSADGHHAPGVLDAALSGSGLFQDPLTHALVETGYVPLGPQAVYWLASNVVDPIQLRRGAFWCWRRCPRGSCSGSFASTPHGSRRPGSQRRSSSCPGRTSGSAEPTRAAFAQPIVLLTVFLLIRGRTRWAAAVPAVGALFYPPAALVALGVLFLSRNRRSRSPPDALTAAPDRRCSIRRCRAAGLRAATNRRAVVGQPDHGVGRAPLPRVRPEWPGAVLPRFGSSKSYEQTTRDSPSPWAEASSWSWRRSCSCCGRPTAG